MRIALAQLNPTVGDVAGNAAAIGEAYRRAVHAGARLVCTGELALTGYPPEDLVFKQAFTTAVTTALDALAQETGEAPLVVGFVEDLAAARGEGDAAHWRPGAGEVTVHPPLANAAAVLRGGAVTAVYRKHRLPNYGVFDEARYFRPGDALTSVEVDGVNVGITICEDLWGAGGPVTRVGREHDAGLVLNLNASPYSRGKRAEREHWARHHARAGDTWIAYLNQVGGQDEVVFDGDSFVMAPDGEVIARGAQFNEDLLVVDVPIGPTEGSGAGEVAAFPAPAPRLDPVAEAYEALVLGTRDYVRKNGFSSALLGLSGGIDSALVAAVAADALGPDAVTTVGMPSPWSSPGSLADSEKLAAAFGLRWLVLPIKGPMAAFDEVLAGEFADTAPGVAEENLQSRIRGTLLMALSNKFGSIVLATGNKSEYAVGYSTLYGDMAGGFAVIKDVSKTLVYELCEHRNSTAGRDLIPRAIIDKPPSAELRPDQRDTDSLPPYDVLDPILEAYVEQDASVVDIVGRGFDRATVERVARLVDRAEYKRRQAAPGVKITARAFGKDRRLPITQAWSG